MTVPETLEAPVTVDECRRIFQPVPFFGELHEDDVAALSQVMTRRDYRAGSTIFYEDDPSDAVYFLAQGIVEVFKSDQTGKKLPLAILRGGGLLGEMGLLNRQPRTATARALGAVQLLVLPAETFHRLLDEGSVPAHRLVHAFARVLAQRLTAMDERLFDLFENETDNERFREINEFKQRLMTTWTSLSIDSRA